MATNNDTDTLSYALAKQVPAMECGCTIQTSCGELAIAAEDAGRIAACVKSVLTQKLVRLGASANLPVSYEAKALDDSADALRQAGTLFSVFDYYARGGDMEHCGVVNLAEIGMSVCGRAAERAQEIADEVRHD